MEAGRRFLLRSEVAILLLSAALCLAAASEERTATTEAFDPSPNATEPPTDNGMAIGDIPTETTTPPTAPQSKEEDPAAHEQHPVVLPFPDNHKNFTPSQYLDDNDFPPYHNHLSTYQQQYKNYYEQKQLYSTKPIKFEENSLKNLYLPTDPPDTNTNLLRPQPNPFPYPFDHTPPHWQHHPYKVNEHSPDDPHHPPTLLRGHRDNHPFLFPSPHQDPPLHNQLLHPHPHHLNDNPNPWKKLFHVLTALVPFGLLLATLTPNVISINSTATTKTTRQRSQDATPLRFTQKDVLTLMKNHGAHPLNDPHCEDRILCELALQGSNPSAGPIEKGFWFLANQTPWDIAEKAGMNDLFKAIRTATCDRYECHPKVQPSGKKRNLKTARR